MAKTIYYYNEAKDSEISSFWGIKPLQDKWGEFHSLSRKISLKDDLHWKEVQNLAKIIKKSNLWDDFPAIGITLVGGEFKAGDEDQRVDLLYIREDGGLLPCELKIGGTAKDTHGQLIRYMADLAFQKIDFEYLNRSREKLYKGKEDRLGLDEKKYRSFLEKNDIKEKHLRLLQKSGIIIDEEFTPQLIKAVRFLNQECGFSIRLIRISAFVEEDWSDPNSEFFMRIDFVDIQ